MRVRERECVSLSVCLSCVVDAEEEEEEEDDDSSLLAPLFQVIHCSPIFLW